MIDNLCECHFGSPLKDILFIQAHLLDAGGLEERDDDVSIISTACARMSGYFSGSPPLNQLIISIIEHLTNLKVSRLVSQDNTEIHKCQEIVRSSTQLL
jgi:hypothetical protein